MDWELGNPPAQHESGHGGLQLTEQGGIEHLQNHLDFPESDLLHNWAERRWWLVARGWWRLAARGHVRVSVQLRSGFLTASTGSTYIGSRPSAGIATLPCTRKHTDLHDSASWWRGVATTMLDVDRPGLGQVGDAEALGTPRTTSREPDPNPWAVRSGQLTDCLPFSTTRTTPADCDRRPGIWKPTLVFGPS